MTQDDIKQVLISVSGKPEFLDIRPDDDFFEFGLDSLDLMDVIFELDSRFGFEVSEDQFASCRSVAGILQIATRLS